MKAMEMLILLIKVMEKSIEKHGDTYLKISDTIKIINNIINYDEKRRIE